MDDELMKAILLEFFETEMDKSLLFKVKKKYDTKQKDLAKKGLSEAKKEEVLADLERLQNELNLQREDSSKREIPGWIEKYANTALKKPQNKTIALATHPIKLTHSSIKGATSILICRQKAEKNYLITTLAERSQVDAAHPDNALAQISKLFLYLYNKEIINPPSVYDFSVFKPFAEDQEQFEKWQQGFSIYYGIGEIISSHSLAKQLYFPNGANYHLLSPLASSCLDQAVFERINHAKFAEISKEIRKRKGQKQYHSAIDVSYPNLAVLKVTASNPSNASIFNGSRGGKRYLLPSTPPQWKSCLKPPINQQDMFYGEFDARAWKSAKSLQKYLLDLQDKKSNKRIRDNVKNSVNDIIDILFNYVAEIQNMTEQAGWSEQATKLKESHQLWLDPYRQDERFQEFRKRGDWLADVCYDFGLWLNRKLKHDKMTFEKLEAKSWANILKKRLREFERDLEVLQ